MLAHNATNLRVPFDFGRLLEEPDGSLFVQGLRVTVDMVAETREQERREAEAKMRGMRT